MNKDIMRKTFYSILLLAAGLLVVLAVISFGGGRRPAAAGTFFGQFVVAGGPIVWFVLLPMSGVMVYLSVERALTIRRAVLVPPGIGSETASRAGQLEGRDLKAVFCGRDDMVGRAFAIALKQGGGDWIRTRNLVFESIQEQALAMLRRIEWINLIGNVSPMVGLFGTVFGMIKLFNAIVLAGGQPRPSQLAEGISVALVTTFWGLFIAIPAVAVYGVLRNRIETLTGEAVVEAEAVIGEVNKSLRRRLQQRNRAAPVAEAAPGPAGAAGRPVRTMEI
jgi:biopolymer transport protein ExbB